MIAPRPALAGAGRTPCSRRIAATRPAIHALPAAVGCSPSRTCAYLHPAASGSMMITAGSAARAAATMARSVREAPRCDRPGKTVSSTIFARGASARITPTACSTRRRSSAGGTPMSSWPACTMTSDGCSARKPARAISAATGPRDPRRPPPGPYVTRPGYPVHDRVPAQVAGQQYRPRPARTRSDPGGERGAHDRQPGHAGPGSPLDLLLARVLAERPGPGRRSRPATQHHRIRDPGMGHGRRGAGRPEREQAGGRHACDYHRTSPGHGQVSAVPQTVSNFQLGHGLTRHARARHGPFGGEIHVVNTSPDRLASHHHRRQSRKQASAYHGRSGFRGGSGQL